MPAISWMRETICEHGQAQRDRGAVTDMGSSPGANLRMQLAREARVVAGITLFAAPTIVYGGITSVGMLTKGTAGFAPGHGQRPADCRPGAFNAAGVVPTPAWRRRSASAKGSQPVDQACPGRRSGVPPAPPTARCPTVTDDRPAGATAPTLAARPRGLWLVGATLDLQPDGRRHASGMGRFLSSTRTIHDRRHRGDADGT